MGVMDGHPPKTGRGKHAEPKTIAYQPAVDPNLASALSQEEIDQIREKAKLKAANEVKDRAAAALLEQFTREERQKLIPEEQLVEIFLDLAPSTAYIMLDGKQYLHHHWYQVPRPVFAVLTEQMNRGWAHDEQTQVVDAKGRRRFRPPMGIGFDNFSGRVGPWGANRNLTVGAGELASTGAAAVMGYKGSVEGLSAA